jgi:hypothetical protein
MESNVSYSQYAITTNSIHGTTVPVEDCGKACLSEKDCAGFVYSSTGRCFLKNQLPSSNRINSNNHTTYFRIE